MKPVLRLLIKVTRHAALHPKAHVVSIIIFSIAIMAIGLATNFRTDTDGDQWTPLDTRSVKHGDWIESDESGFPKDPRYMVLIVHRDGKNVLGDDEWDLAQEGVRRVFNALKIVRETSPGHQVLCDKRDYVHPVTNQTTCDILGVTSYWNDSASLFLENIKSNNDVIEAVSAKTSPGGSRVNFDQIIGYNECDDGTIDGVFGGTLTSGKSDVTVVGLPGKVQVEDEALDYEKGAIDNLRDLNAAWETEKGNDFELELLAYRSVDEEFRRAMSADFPLLPLVFALMSILCIAIFARRDPVLSRSWLDFGAVITVLLALIASFGLLFTIGVPFTNLTPILPQAQLNTVRTPLFSINNSLRFFSLRQVYNFRCGSRRCVHHCRRLHQDRSHG